ncbi:MAG: hypothetical protein QOF78_2624 [Phycisphaerales bacterium]|nr:hypothetical protein [Phycisphaerales bacterium]
MKLTKKNTTLLIAAAAVAALLTIGCNNDKKEVGINAIFKSDGEERVSKFVDVQASNGARADGMLFAHHFTAGHLNSLGRSKVLLMLEDADNDKPAIVHLVDAGEGDLLAQRRASVELYLKTTEGPNKLAFHPAAPNLIRFSKTESGQMDAEAAAAPSASAGAAPMMPQTK